LTSALKSPSAKRVHSAVLRSRQEVRAFTESEAPRKRAADVDPAVQPVGRRQSNGLDTNGLLIDPRRNAAAAGRRSRRRGRLVARRCRGSRVGTRAGVESRPPGQVPMVPAARQVRDGLESSASILDRRVIVPDRTTVDGPRPGSDTARSACKDRVVIEQVAPRLDLRLAELGNPAGLIESAVGSSPWQRRRQPAAALHRLGGRLHRRNTPACAVSGARAVRQERLTHVAGVISKRHAMPNQ
jgi:hypothetical protein